MHKRYGFELLENTPEEKVFKTTCDCGDPDDDCDVRIVLDKDSKKLSMQFFIKTFFIPYKWIGKLGFFEVVTSRIKGAFNILRGKPLEYDSTFIFRGRNHIEDFSDMLLLLAKECEKEHNELEECKKKLKKLEGRRA